MAGNNSLLTRTDRAGSISDLCYLSVVAGPATTVTTAVIESPRASRLFAFVKLYEEQDRAGLSHERAWTLWR
jgi:hypothetical protein